MDKLLKIHKYSFNHPEELELDFENIEWLGEVFDSLESITDTNLGDEKDALHVKLSLLRKTNSALREHFVIRGSIDCSYHAACIRCLAPAKETVGFDFAACYLHRSMENMEEFKDLTDIYADGEEMELYFYDKGKINLQDLINEQIHLNVNPRPLHSENCKGLCPICGFNLNFGKCIHQRTEKK